MIFSAKDKRQAAEHEVAMRISVYPRLVAKGSMTQAKADQKIAVMKAIVEDYAQIEKAEIEAERLI